MKGQTAKVAPTVHELPIAGRSHKALSVRFALLTYNTFAILVVTGFISLLWYKASLNDLHSVLQDSLDQYANKVEDSIRVLFNNATSLVLNLEDMFYAQQFDPTDLARTGALLALVQTSVVKAGGLYLGTELGNFIGTDINNTDGKYSISLRDDNSTDGYLTYTYFDYAFDPFYSVNISKPPHFTSPQLFDPRVRPWYVEAVARLDEFIDETIFVHWSDIYLYANGVLGMTVSRPVFHPLQEETLVGVIGDDILLEQIQMLLQNDPFIVENDAMVILLDRHNPEETTFIGCSDPGQPIVSEGENGVVARLPYTQRDTSRVRKTLGHFDSRFGHPGDIDETRFEEVNGELVLAKTSLFDWVLIVAVHESRFIDDVEKGRTIVIVISSMLCLVGIIVSISATKAITRPLFEVCSLMENVTNYEFTGSVPADSSLQEIRMIQESMGSMMAALRSFSKYVPQTVVRTLLLHNSEASLGMQPAVVTVFFSDIESFTSISESMPLPRLVELMSTFFSRWTTIINESGGVVDKFIGDAIMAFWNAPTECQDHEKVGAKTCLALQDALRQLQEDWRKKGFPLIRARIGMHTGQVLVGNMGSPSRLNYTVVGDTVNLASRLEGANKRYHTYIMISDAVFGAVRPSFLCRPLDIIAVKGKSSFTEVFELMCETSKATPEQNVLSRLTLSAFASFKARRFDSAMKLLQQASEVKPEDPSIGFMIQRCIHLIEHPPKSDADLGVALTEK
eukprot:Rmarinus@m.3255